MYLVQNIECSAMRNSVPCNGCQACCKNQRIILTAADDPSQYITIPTKRGNQGKLQLMLAHKANGDCIYLDEGGCSIHDRAPQVCKSFDCRAWFRSFTESDRELLLSDDSYDRETARAAKARLK